MAEEYTYRLPSSREGLPQSVVLGSAFAVALFILMALAQMMTKSAPPKRSLEETMVAFAAPVIEEIDEPPPPELEEEEPPPELEEAPPQLTLDQLDIALRPGTGGSLAGDFSMPTIGTSAKDLGTEDFVDFSDLDQVPRPVGNPQFRIPSRLKKKKVSGKVVLLMKLDEQGKVIDLTIDSSDLPQFNDVVLSQVKRWRFTPPTMRGQPVKAQARMPFPIRIN